MTHLQAFRARDVVALPAAVQAGWRLKRYAILAQGRDFDDGIAQAATAEALTRLPAPGPLDDAGGNHGVGFQIVHFAEVAVVSPTFYWQWGSVLAHIDQLRAPWSDPTTFDTGKTEVFGCVWEMEIVTFEVQTWTRTMLSGQGDSAGNRAAYMARMLG